jgi:hemoglobin
MATGGPNNYHGKDMKDAHKGRGIGSKEFDLVCGHVIASMKELGVNETLIDEVCALLLPLRPACTE